MRLRIISNNLDLDTLNNILTQLEENVAHESKGQVVFKVLNRNGKEFECILDSPMQNPLTNYIMKKALKKKINDFIKEKLNIENAIEIK